MRHTRHPARAIVALGMAAALVGTDAAEAAMRHRAAPPPVEAQPFSLDKPEPQFPVGAHWTLMTINGKTVEGDAPSFTLDDKLRATGFSGCNTYSMTLYPVRGQKLASGSIATTHKQCDKALLLLEREVLVTLHSLPNWDMEGSDLVIKSARTQLRFRRGV